MEKLLLDLLHGDCRAASWAFCAGERDRGERLLLRAEEFLGHLADWRASERWRPVVTGLARAA
jgi:hypothetical protein